MITLRRVREPVSRGVAAAILAALVATPLPAAASPPAREAIVADTAGTGLLEWAYDLWTVPWVQATRESKLLDPGSYATLVALACESASLERDRKARHLSPEDCEHRMAAIRAEHDTALIFRVHLRVLDRAGASELVRMGPRVHALLEDDHGWQWGPRDMRRGATLGMATGQKVKRVYQYHPQWMRGRDYVHADEYRMSNGQGVTSVEYLVRFPRRDPGTGERILTPETRWLRLRLGDGRREWVATWPFLPDSVGDEIRGSAVHDAPGTR